jgi:hypothetical protein
MRFLASEALHARGGESMINNYVIKKYQNPISPLASQKRCTKLDEGSANIQFTAMQG